VSVVVPVVIGSIWTQFIIIWVVSSSGLIIVVKISFWLFIVRVPINGFRFVWLIAVSRLVILEVGHVWGRGGLVMVIVCVLVVGVEISHRGLVVV
jgi:hypothetical protein